MSSDDNESNANTKVYKLKSRKKFQSRKQKNLSMASSRGYVRFLLEDLQIDDDQEIKRKENDHINEVDDELRRKKKIILSKARRDKKKSLEHQVC